MIAGCQVGGGDLLIKLFGKTIPVPESGDAKDLQQSSSNSSSSTEQDQQDAHAPENGHAHQDTPDPPPQPEVVDAEDPAAKSSPDETHQKPGHRDGDGDAASQREKLRKPDKVLPCPRCSSMDTKFCYFNNYNVNQPRHFCKNCQRYWTAGGAMRNVPVGAGRRKNKNAAAAAAASHFLLHRVRACGGGVGGDTLRSTTTNGTVLSFGGGHGGAPPPTCLDLAEQLGHHLAPPPPARNAGGNPAAGPACSEGSSNRDANNDSRSCVDEAGAANGDGSVSVPVQQQQQHPAAASMNGVWPPPYGCAPSPAAAYFSSGIAIPMIYPAAPGYWGCVVPPGAWSLPWPVQQQPASASSPTATASAPSASSSGAGDAHTMGLGKHPRDRECDDGGRNGGNGSGHGNAKVWAPKTIRIDDVDEVARSSIWSLIGIRGDKNSKQQDAADGAGGGHKQQLGTVFEPKRGEAGKKQQAMMTSSSPLLHANPVALTRSVAFQEGSA